MAKNKLKASIYLLLAAAIWGLTFVAQSKGMEHIGTMTFSTIRCLIGGAVTLAMSMNSFLKKRVLEEEGLIVDEAATRRGGLVTGIVLFFAMNIQQIGISQTTVGKAGFITTLYIIVVPILMMFKGYKLTKKLMACIILAIYGVYLLSVKENLTIDRGDLIVFISTIFFSIHILVIAHYSPITDGLRLNAYQFIVCGILSMVFAVAFEQVTFEAIRMAIWSILYASIMSSAVAFTLQIIALRHIDAALSSLISSVESIFAALGGYLILGEVLSKRELIGCLLMFIAIVAAQLGTEKNEE